MTKLKLPIYAAFRSQNQLEMNEETHSKDSREREGLHMNVSFITVYMQNTSSSMEQIIQQVW